MGERTQVKFNGGVLSLYKHATTCLLHMFDDFSSVAIQKNHLVKVYVHVQSRCLSERLPIFMPSAVLENDCIHSLTKTGNGSSFHFCLYDRKKWYLILILISLTIREVEQLWKFNSQGEVSLIYQFVSFHLQTTQAMGNNSKVSKNIARFINGKIDQSHED